MKVSTSSPYQLEQTQAKKPSWLHCTSLHSASSSLPRSVRHTLRHTHKDEGRPSFLLTYKWITIWRFISNIYRSSGVQQCDTVLWSLVNWDSENEKSISCSRAAGQRIFSSDRPSGVSTKACVNMSELQRDIRRRRLQREKRVCGVGGWGGKC